MNANKTVGLYLRLSAFIRGQDCFVNPNWVPASLNPNLVVDPAKFTDIIGRHFKQPKEGLGNDNSSTAHMWRRIANPDAPL